MTEIVGGVGLVGGPGCVSVGSDAAGGGPGGGVGGSGADAQLTGIIKAINNKAK